MTRLNLLTFLLVLKSLQEVASSSSNAENQHFKTPSFFQRGPRNRWVFRNDASESSGHHDNARSNADSTFDSESFTGFAPPLVNTEIFDHDFHSILSRPRRADNTNVNNVKPKVWALPSLSFDRSRKVRIFHQPKDGGYSKWYENTAQQSNAVFDAALRQFHETLLWKLLDERDQYEDFSLHESPYEMNLKLPLPTERSLGSRTGLDETSAARSKPEALHQHGRLIELSFIPRFRRARARSTRPSLFTGKLIRNLPHESLYFSSEPKSRTTSRAKIHYRKGATDFNFLGSRANLGENARSPHEEHAGLSIPDGSSSKHKESVEISALNSTGTQIFDGHFHYAYNFSIGSLIIDYLTYEKLGSEMVQKDCTAKLINTNDVVLAMVKFTPTATADSFELCSKMKDAPVVETYCGRVFLLPGFRFRLVPNAFNCTWHFRSAVSAVMLNFAIGGQEGQIQFHALDQVLRYRASRNSVEEFPHKEFQLTLKNGSISELSAEICIPANYNIFDHYKHFGPYDETLLLPKNDACGKKHVLDSKKSRLSYNETVDPVPFNAFPWQALLIIKTSLSDLGELPVICSGALVAQDWLVTMASCFSSAWEVTGRSKDGSSMPFVGVHFGMSQLSDMVMSERYHVEDIVLYPALSTFHDIALVRLSSTPPRLDPVCLPPFQKPDPNHEIVNGSGHVIGWTIKRDSKLPQDLFLSTEKIIEGKKCSTSIKEYLPQHTVCTANSTHSDRCLLDSLLYDVTDGKYVLRGLAYNRGRCDGSGLNVFTSVAHFVPWIADVVAERANALPRDTSNTTQTVL